MTIFSSLQTISSLLLEDSLQQLHPLTFIQPMLEHGELFINLTRADYEKTGDLTLSLNTPTYVVHSTLTDYIRTLRVSISNVTLKRTTLASLATIDSSFYTTTGTPTLYYEVGNTILGFYPVPDGAYTAKVTYLAAPPTDVTDFTTSPKIQTLLHTLLPHYVASIGYAREGKIEEAVEHLKSFMGGLGLPLNKKFSAILRQKRRENQEFKPIPEISQ